MTNKPSKEELRVMLDEGQTLYQISRKFNMTIPEVQKWRVDYDMTFSWYKIPHPTKQDLESMYYDENMTQRQIAKEFDVSQWNVGIWIHNYEISTVGRMGAYINGSRVIIPTKDVLERMYNDEHINQYQIAKEFNVSHETVRRWLQYYSISTVGRQGAPVPIHPKEVIERMYNDERLSQEQIAKEFDVSQVTVFRWMSHYGIPTRGPNGTLNVPMPPKDELEKLIDEDLNQHQIAEHFKVCDATIFNWCEHLYIPGMVNGYRFTTPEHIAWRYAVFYRDHHTCQKCGATNTRIEAHHIVPYADHPEIAYELDNGITLCYQCHKNILGREYDYITQFAAITQPHLHKHEVIESMPWEPPLELHSIIDYPQEATT